mmetsp:Transcript_19522/g.39149  ORF Transcript_19522/g.39149 Transcript_19522/m.39149 type:complete len:114 (+) Transcript_19522:1872-2213(+)
MLMGQPRLHGAGSTKTKQKKAATIKEDCVHDHIYYTNASRGKLLKKELAKYNLTRRKDSKLCDAFVKGTTSKSVQEVTSASDQHHVHVQVQNQNEVSIRGLLQRVQHFSKRLL